MLLFGYLVFGYYCFCVLLFIVCFVYLSVFDCFPVCCLALLFCVCCFGFVAMFVVSFGIIVLMHSVYS